jgi:glyceraldehyde 3-phosphate dehydrogenase
MKGIVQYLETPVVSSDVIGNPYSSIFDPAFTSVTAGRYLKTLNWYDNEWGYSNRVVDLISRLSAWT